ncbi:MAG: rhomboid family intramembrane serine protease [Alphaproteobacteria bacterium]|nr:rhomboid family intramembrane serine protease [Alphaproteobacteria bacterium]
MSFPENGRPAREPFLNAPAVVLWLIGIILLAHFTRVVLPGDWPDRLIFDYALIPARFAEGLEAGWPPGGLFALLITLLTYIFLHGDITHVVVNSLWLLAFGPIVARRLGLTRFLAYFFLCGLAAALLHLAVYWGSPAAVVGASGSVSGLMGGAMRIVYGRLHGEGEGRDALATIFSKPILAFTAIWMVANAVSGIFRIGVSDDLTLVAWVAHLGGYFAGLLTLGMFDPFSVARGRPHSA